jgi:diadenosine tetraphosphate (Ap4A) HIT family hydrolase
MASSPCVLCQSAGEIVLWRDAVCRVIRVDDPAYPGFCRVIWHDHIREMTDLSAEQQQHLMRVVFAVERVVRTCYQPDKINLAAFGNMVPHLHWHIIPRWTDDRHFPEPIWGQVQRESAMIRTLMTDSSLQQALVQLLGPTTE